MYQVSNVLPSYLSLDFTESIKNTQIRSMPNSFHFPTSEAFNSVKITCIFININYLLTCLPSCIWATFLFSLHIFRFSGSVQSKYASGQYASSMFYKRNLTMLLSFSLFFLNIQIWQRASIIRYRNMEASYYTRSQDNI